MTERLEYLFLVFPVAGVCLFLGGLKYRRRLKEKAGACLQTGGTVVGNMERMSGGFEGAPVFHPIVEYFVGGQRFSVTSDAGYLPRKKEGTKLGVMYNPANPATAFVVQDYYTVANLLLAIGGVFVCLGVLIACLMLLSRH